MLSRIWYSAATGKIAPKDVAANWAMEHLPAQHQSVLLEARQAYLGQEEDRSVLRADKLEEFIHFMKSEITKVLGNDVPTMRSPIRFAARLNFPGVRRPRRQGAY